MDPETFRQIDARRRALGARRLVRLAEFFVSSTNDTLREEGFADFQDAHTKVLFNLELDGNRITTLAERARVSVQAMGKLVRDLERKGYVTRERDPSDGRAQIVRLTERGLSFFETGVDVIEAQERRFADVVGGESWDALVEAAGALVDEFDPENF